MAASRAPSCRTAHLLCTAHWQKALDEYITLESDVQNVWNQLTEQHRQLFTKHPRLVHEWTDGVCILEANLLALGALDDPLGDVAVGSVVANEDVLMKRVD
jgi:hypothetical protein